MQKNKISTIATASLASLALLMGGTAAMAQQTAVIDVSKPAKGADVANTMYGLFFEDINYAADGGLYAEMVKNRSFEFPQSLMGWEAFGKFEVRTDAPAFDRNPHYVRLSDPGHRHKRTGLSNEGFFGVALQKGHEYRFSVWARAVEDNSKLQVELIDPASMDETQVMGHTQVTIEGKEWKKYTATVKSNADVAKGKLRIFLAGAAVDLDHISLFPTDTWKGRENGLRTDLAQALADIKPGVLRFPGGCIVEGTDLASRYQWKNSVGPVENRPLNENRWEYTFPHRHFPDYHQSYGLGFYEFFLLSEDIGAEPLPILSVGLACQFQNNTADAHVEATAEALKPYIDDALDLIEFANGATTTKWGKLRADMGHAEPFNLKYIGIGNEQWDQLYPDRLKFFVETIRKAHPEIKIVGSSGPDSEGKQFDFLWPEMKKLGADLVDEHFYRPETWFLAQGNRYDNYDRKGPKVFAGEYACHGKGKKWNHFNASLLEAAFMTGLERNADIVRMATYAPLFAHVEGWQWRPDMIWYDNTRSVRTASYYVQQLFSTNKGTNVLKMTANGKPLAGNDDQNGLSASAVYDANDGSFVVKVANVSDQQQELTLQFKGLGKKQKLGETSVTTLHADDPVTENTLDNPTAVVPQISSLAAPAGNELKVTLNAKTFYVFRVAVK